MKNILYKYFSYSGGLKAIGSRHYGFTAPVYFNDPFELTYLIGETYGKKSHNLKNLVNGLRDSVGVLCLTRSHLNALMWAHYAESHTGFVVAYDVDDDFLTSSLYNLIPVQEGEVEYVSKFDQIGFQKIDWSDINNVSLLSCGVDVEVTKKIRGALQHVYLKKHNVWRYECEVRVVKLIDSIFVATDEFQSNPFRSCIWGERGLKFFNGRLAKIDAVYLGIRNPLLQVNNKNELNDRLSMWRDFGVHSFFGVQADLSNWALSTFSLNA